ncbi:MAG: hypothetical protein KatS3mg095_0100 [Candidatus Parcubacteria bacterium]|nr:MAG: hypothetical protein KatS3mg095_0100 [Candidatus Parcubacteria bacterium]
MIYLKKKYFLFFIFILLPYYVFSQNNKCLNFTGGVGEFEIIDKNQAKKVFIDNSFIAKPAGWSFYKDNGVDVKLNIDRNNYYNNETSRGSLKADINKNVNTSLAFKLTHQIYTDYPYISTPTTNFYPKSGDLIEINLKLKTNNSNNLKPKILVNVSTTQNYLNVLNKEFLLSSSDWQSLFASTVLPTNQGNILRLDIIIEIRFIQSNQNYFGSIWLDDLKLYSYRNGSCLTIPEKSLSSLKFTEINQYFSCYDNNCKNYNRNKDFIKLYLEADSWWGEEDDISLKVKYLNNNFKRITYFLPTILRRENPTSESITSCRSSHEGSILEFLDRYCITNPIINYSATVNRLHPNALYSNLIEHFSGNNYVIWYTPDHIRIKMNPELAEILSKTFLKYYKIFFSNSLFKTDFLGFDVFEDYGYPDRNIARRVNQPIFLNILKKALIPYINYFGNVGYYIYADPNEQNSGSNWHSQFKFTNGYLNEKFLEPNYFISPNPSLLHKQFKSLIENKSYDIIVSISNYNVCSETDKFINFMIASFYLTNQNNNYYAITKPADYSTPQCYPQLLYLPLGNPLEVNYIEELVIASTSNFTNGGLYKRNYENGLILVNTSHNNNFSYTLSNTSEPINFNIYQDQYGNIYNVSQNPINLIINTTTGLILYSPYQNLELRP